MLVGIAVQRLTSRGSSKVQPPDLVHEPVRLPVPEIQQVPYVFLQRAIYVVSLRIQSCNLYNGCCSCLTNCR